MESIDYTVTNTVTVPIDDYAELVRISERARQAVNCINRCQYSPSKKELISILTGENVKEEE